MTPGFGVIRVAQSRLRVLPCDLSEANEFVRQHHRHHQPVPGHKFFSSSGGQAPAPEKAAVGGVGVKRELNWRGLRNLLLLAGWVAAMVMGLALGFVRLFGALV